MRHTRAPIPPFRHHAERRGRSGRTRTLPPLWTARPISAASYHPAAEWSICASAISTPRQLAEAGSGREDPGKRGIGAGNRWRPGVHRPRQRGGRRE
jgi:hypothetical protein